MGFFQTSGILNRRGFFGGAAKAFSPTDIAGLQLWLDATTGLFDATTGGSAVTTDGSAVARWEDQSGNGNHVTQGTVNNRPILKTSIRNSKNIVRYDGSNDLLASASISANNLPKVSCFSVLYRNGLGGGNFGRLFVRGNENIGWITNVDNNMTLQIAGKNQDTAVGSVTTGSWYLLSAKWDGGTSVASNVSQRVNQAASSRNLTGTITPPNVANTVLHIGNRNALNRALDGDIAELLIYNEELTASQITSVETYLAGKWGF